MALESGSWYRRVTADANDLSPVAEACEYFDAEYIEARKSLDTRGRRIEEVARNLPQVVDHRFCQLQEIEAIMRYLEIRKDQKLAEKRRGYIEHYNRQLTDRMAEKFAEGDDAVVDFALLINEVALVRNKFAGLSKGLEYLHFQLSNITKLRSAGIEDATL